MMKLGEVDNGNIEFGITDTGPAVKYQKGKLNIGIKKEKEGYSGGVNYQTNF